MFARTHRVGSVLIVLISNCPGGDFAGLRGGSRTGMSSGKPLLLPVVKQNTARIIKTTIRRIRNADNCK